MYMHICIGIHMSTAKPSRYISPFSLPRLFAPLSLSDFLRVLPLNWTPTVQFVRIETETRWNPGGKSRRQTAMRRTGGGIVEILRHLHRNQNGNKTTFKSMLKLFDEKKEEKRTARQILFAVSWYDVRSNDQIRAFEISLTLYRANYFCHWKRMRAGKYQNKTITKQIYVLILFLIYGRLMQNSWNYHYIIYYTRTINSLKDTTKLPKEE